MAKLQADWRRGGTVALRKMVDRLTKPIDELDREALEHYCDELGATPMNQITARTPIRVAGEIRSVRIVPRAGAPAMEVTASDGRGSVVAVFLGRRKIAGMSPGRRVLLSGVAGRDGNRFILYNPEYSLLG
jgi:RecG-like helicase